MGEDQLPIDESEWHKCNYCGKDFLSKQRLEDHRQVVHLGQGSGCIQSILEFLFRVFGVLFIIAIIVFGAVCEREYHKQIVKEAIEEANK